MHVHGLHFAPQSAQRHAARTSLITTHITQSNHSPYHSPLNTMTNSFALARSLLISELRVDPNWRCRVS